MKSNLAEGSLTDWAGVMISAAEAVASDDLTHHLVGLPILLLDVALANEAELAFVRALFPAPEMLVVAPAADKPTLIRLREGLRVEIEELDSGDRSPGTLARLQRHIFSEASTSAPLVPDNQVLASRHQVKVVNAWKLRVACSISRNTGSPSIVCGAALPRGVSRAS